jgi:hypothetical protein
MIATAKRCDKSQIFIKLNCKNDNFFISGHKKQSLVREILSAKAPKDMLATGRPSPTGLAGRQLFENCQVCRSAPSERLEAKTLEILTWRSIFVSAIGQTAQGCALSWFRLARAQAAMTSRELVKQLPTREVQKTANFKGAPVGLYDIFWMKWVAYEDQWIRLHIQYQNYPF